MASTASAALAASSGIVSSSCSNRLVTSVSNSGGGGGGGGDVSSSFLHPLLRTGTSFRGSVVGLTVRGGQEGNWTNRRWSGNGGGGGGGVVTTAAVSVEPPPVPKQQKKSQYEIETFTGWLLRQEQIGVIDAELTIVLSSISVACKQIASLVQRAGISNLTGLQGASNIQGEDQKKLDVISNEVLLSLSLSLSSSWTKHNPIPSVTFSSSSLLHPSYASRHYRRMWFFSHKRLQVMTHVCVR
jgi:fructose-1,6-bisphosphatase I